MCTKELQKRTTGFDAVENSGSGRDTMAAPSGHGSGKLPRLLLAWFVVLTLVKLLLTAHEEIVSLFAPHDDLWQVMAADRWYWGGVYEPTFLYHLAVYPLFVKLVSFTGIPLRVVIELIFCVSVSWFSAAFWRLGAPGKVVGLMAAAVIFHPATFQSFNRFGAEVLLTPLLIFALAGSLHWWAGRRGPGSWKSAVMAAVFWALAWNVRKEAITLLPVFVAMAFCVLFLDRSEGWRAWKRLCLGAGLPLAACAVLSFSIKTANYCRWGLFSDSVLTAPGYKAAFKALQKIRPDHYIDYMPVTSEVRAKAYKISPAFRMLEPWLEGPIGAGWAKHSKAWTDGKGVTGLDPSEISAGWFYWALYESAVAADLKAGPGEIDRFFAKAAWEINAALDDGRLPGRFVPVAMIDPEFHQWAPRLGASISAVYRVFLSPTVRVRPNVEGEFPAPKFLNQINNMANRRANLVRNTRAVLTGWVLPSAGRISSMALQFPDGSTVPAAQTIYSRPDVGTGAVGFHFEIPVHAEKDWRSIGLAVNLENGGKLRWKLRSLKAGKYEQQDLAGETVQLWPEFAQKPSFSSLLSWEARWEKGYCAAVRWMQWMALGGLLLAVVSFFRRKDELFAAAVIWIMAAFVSRVSLFSILDASAWSGDQPRYLLAVMPLHTILLVLGIGYLLKAIVGYLQRYRNQGRIPISRSPANAI